MLRIAIDQLILILTKESSKFPAQCDCIGAFLKLEDLCEFNEGIQDKKFLIGLNITANYLKHHPYQFDNQNEFPLKTPSLLVTLDKDIRGNFKKEHISFKNLFKNELRRNTMYTKNAYINDIRSFLADKEYDPALVAKKTYKIYIEHVREINPQLREKLLDITNMEMGQEFEMTQDEFMKFLNEL